MGLAGHGVRRWHACRPCPPRPIGAASPVCRAATTGSSPASRAGGRDRWGVEPTVVRAALGLLTLAGGIGVVLYGDRRPRLHAAGRATEAGRAAAVASVTGAASWRIGCGTAGDPRRRPRDRAVAGRRHHDPCRGGRRRHRRRVVARQGRGDDARRRPASSGPCRSSPASCCWRRACCRSPAAPAGWPASARRRARSRSSSAGWRSSPHRPSVACCDRSTTSGRCASARTSGRPSPPTCTTRCCSRWC